MQHASSLWAWYINQDSLAQKKWRVSTMKADGIVDGHERNSEETWDQ
jgi:hypothetical protein